MAMNFFAAQAAARRRSAWLIVLFVLAVLAIVAMLDFGVALMFARRNGSGPGMGKVVAFTSVATLGLIGIASMVRMARLRGSGGKLALELGAVRVAEDAREPRYRRLRNVVEEMAIASGVPVPEIYVLEEEAAINAFAAGWSPADAAITVTRGALERLNRDELQGVIAHEFSHILNGDMRLNIRLIGILFGILVLGIVGRRILTSGSSSRSRGAAAVYLFAFLLLVVGYVGLFFGRLIKAGLSRQREYLADASAVQFTRQSSGIAGALKKIGGLMEGSRLNAAQAEEAAHMYFGDGIGYGALFATHPPLLKRIQALEPGFQADALDRLTLRWVRSPPDGASEDLELGFAEAAPTPLPSPQVTIPIEPAKVAAQVGVVHDGQSRHAAVLRERIPEPLQEAARRIDRAMPLVFALILEADPALRDRQRSLIDERHGPALLAATDELTVAVANLHPMLRLPLALLVFPVLRRRPRPELETFIASVDAMAAVAGQRGLFEYCLACLLHRQLRDSLDPTAAWVAGRRKLPEAAREIATLLALVARYGHDLEDDARRAFLAGLSVVLPAAGIAYAPPDEGVVALDAGWDVLDALDPMAKELLIEALATTIASDGQVSVSEAELLRTVCGALHCPLPPLLAA